LTTNPQNSDVDDGQPGAALLRHADRLASALDDYRHQVNNLPFPGTDEAQTVQVAVTANFRITELIIEEGLLSLGTEVVVQRVTEALSNAQAAAKRDRQDRAEKLSGALGLTPDLKQQFDSALDDIRSDRGVQG
jgi:DNA-binding protein YbaB